MIISKADFGVLISSLRELHIGTSNKDTLELYVKLNKIMGEVEYEKANYLSIVSLAGDFDFMYDKRNGVADGNTKGERSDPDQADTSNLVAD